MHLQGVIPGSVHYLTMGGRLGWSPGNRIVYDRLDVGADYYQIHVINPDGTGATDLTTGKAGAPARHKGCPEWHPDLTHIVFAAVDDEYAGDLGLAWPGIGRGNSLWVMDAAGDNYWHIYDRAGVGYLLHPHFTPSGDRLAWSESADGAVFNICHAPFTLTPIPAIGTVTRFQPLGAVWYETQGWDNDGVNLLFSAHLVYDPVTDARMDLYVYNRVSDVTTRLTSMPTTLNEHAKVKPGDNNQLSMAASIGAGFWPANLYSYQLVPYALSKLTHFDSRSYPEWLGGDASVTDHSWSADGTRIAMRLKRGSDGVRDRIYILTV